MQAIQAIKSLREPRIPTLLPVRTQWAKNPMCPKCANPVDTGKLVAVPKLGLNGWKRKARLKATNESAKSRAVEHRAGGDGRAVGFDTWKEKKVVQGKVP